MRLLRRAVLQSSFLLALLWPCTAQPIEAPRADLTAETIMARVAANQDRTEAERLHYIYLQHIRMTSHKPGGRVMCEEVTDTRITPERGVSHQELQSLNGRYWQKNRYVTYTQFPKQMEESKDDGGLDCGLLQSLRGSLAEDKSRDALGRGLFPLTTKEQANYRFTLLGRQAMNGREVFHLGFAPHDKNDFDWKGEAFIDTTEFQPVVVLTKLSRKMPILVRTMLGTNLPGLGFTVTYARQQDGVWFPATFGTEFRMRILFFIARDITMALDNSHFEKTHSSAHIVDGNAQVPAPAKP